MNVPPPPPRTGPRPEPLDSMRRAAQPGSTPQTPTDGASPGAAQEATGSSPGSAVRTQRKDDLTRAYSMLSQARMELVQARKNPHGFSGPEAFFERLKQQLGMATKNPQTGMWRPAGPAKTPIALAPPKADPTDADLEAMRAAFFEAQAGMPKADPAPQEPSTPKEPGLREILLKEMTTDQRLSFMNMLRADLPSTIPSKPPGAIALAADLATLESMLNQATL